MYSKPLQLLSLKKKKECLWFSVLMLSWWILCSVGDVLYMQATVETKPQSV